MKTSNKKKLVVAGVIGVAAIAATIGTISYFKDTDHKENVFTVGNVEINLAEKARAINPDGSYGDLGDFEQERTLSPLVGSETASGYDNNNLPLAKNYGDKVVTVTNEGITDAYIRVYVGIPKMLDNENPTENFLHFNFGLNSSNQKTSEAGTGDWLWKTNNAWNYNDFTLATAPLSTTSGLSSKDIDYAVYYADYHEAVAAGATTERFLNGAYLDSNIDYINVDTNSTTGAKTTTFCKNKDKAGEDCAVLNYDVNEYGLQLPVFVVAVQADGFADAASAMTAAGFTATTNPWTL